MTAKKKPEAKKSAKTASFEEVVEKLDDIYDTAREAAAAGGPEAKKWSRVASLALTTMQVARG